MACKVFISTSGIDSVAWTDELTKTVAEFCQLTQKDDVYWYRGSRLASNVEKEVAENARSALVLLCIVTDEYLTSPWCLREHFWFCEDKSRVQYARAVLASGLRSWPESRDANAADEFVRTNLDKLKREIELQFLSQYDALSKYAEDYWFNWLRTTENTNLRTYKTVRAGDIPKSFHQFESLKRLLDHVSSDLANAEQVRERQRNDPERKALHAAANLSAFALAADRYFDGGWGFSTGYEVDEEGQELISGRYDLNLVILRALEVFLSPRDFRREWESALGEVVRGRQARRVVTDRLSSVARFLACMERGELFRPEILSWSDEIAAELSAEPSTKRWGLDSEVIKPSAHHVVLHEFVFRAFKLFGNDSLFASRLEKTLVPAADDARFASRLEKTLFASKVIENKVEELERLVSRWLSDNNIFWEFVENSTRSATSRSEASHNEARVLRSTLWCLLAASDKGLQLLSHELQKPYAYGKWDLGSFDRFQRAVSQSIDEALTNPESSSGTLTFASVCAYVLHTLAKQYAGMFETQSQLLRISMKRAFTSSAAESLLLKMNSLGWAVVILLANNILEVSDPQFGLDLGCLAEMWKRGRRLRELRVETLSLCTVEALKERELEKVVTKHINDLVANHGSRLSISPDRQDGFANLKKNLLESTFWSAPLDTSNEDGLKDSSLTGVLQVKLPSGRVDLESNGYSRLFLYPFSKLTKMNVYDLMGVRRELGEKDTTLVEKMGAVVVEECYARGQDGFRREDFKKRTDQITEWLKTSDWQRHLGVSDLLKLRTGEEGGHRWVYRSALIQPEYGARPDDEKGTKDSGRTIAWYFIQMPEQIAALIDYDTSPMPDPPISRATAT